MKNHSLKETRQRIADLKIESDGLLEKAELAAEDNERIDAIVKEAEELRGHEGRLLAAAGSPAWKPADRGNARMDAFEAAGGDPLVRQPRTAVRASIKAWEGFYRPSGPFENFGDFLGAVYNAARAGGRVDPRLISAAASGMSETIPSDGGFLVGKDYSTLLLDRSVETSVLAQRCYSQPIGADSDGIELPFVDETSRAKGSRWGGIRVYRAAEAATVAASNPKIGRAEIRLEDLIGIGYMTERLLKDSTAASGFMAKAFTSEFAFTLDDEIVRGTGGGQMLGILKAPATVSVPKESGQLAATLVFQNIQKMFARLAPRFMANANVFVNNEVLPAIWGMDFPVGTGGSPAFMPPGGLSARPYMSVMGLPVIPVEQCEALGTVGDVIMADLSDYMLIDKGGIESAESIHVRFLNNERTFRFVYRVNGQPMLRNAVTPYKGNNALSAYVTLATRA